MKQHSGVPGRLATLKLLAQRFAFISIVMASFGLMLLGKADTVLVERVRATVGDVVAPVLDVMSRPAAAVAQVVTNVRDLANLRAENTMLREQNERLRHWQTVASRLDFENRALRSQLNYVPDPDSAFITARAVGDTGGAFVRSVLIDAGGSEGVRKGQAVVVGQDLIGRIAEVGRHSARVMLLTDINAHIPVMIETTRAKAILTGDNSERPHLNYLAPSAMVAPGDRIVTSGDGGIFPPGLPVGVVSSAQDGVVLVEPFVHRYQIEYVTVVDYGLPGILADEQSGDDRSDQGDSSP